MTWTFCPGRIPRALRTRRGMTTWNFVETVLVSIQTSYRTASRITAPFYQEAPSGSRGGWAPNGLEMSRPASRGLVSHKWSRPGWPGRLHRVVRRHARLRSVLGGAPEAGRSQPLLGRPSRAAHREPVQVRGRSLGDWRGASLHGSIGHLG